MLLSKEQVNMMGCASGGVTSEMPARISLILTLFFAAFNAVFILLPGRK
jgi:hypothetical protein